MGRYRAVNVAAYSLSGFANNNFAPKSWVLSGDCGVLDVVKNYNYAGKSAFSFNYNPVHQLAPCPSIR